MEKSNLQDTNESCDEELTEEEELDLNNMDSYFDAEIGDLVKSQFCILKKLGQGQFSNVWLCRDILKSEYIAMKVIRSKTFYRECGHHEINMFKKIPSTDPSDQRCERLMKLSENFIVPSKVEGVHVCMVFQTIGYDLRSFIQERYSEGAPLFKVKSIIRQILEGVDYLHSKCGIIHTDLKPENILICLGDDDIRMIVDFANMQEIRPESGEDQINKNAESSFGKIQETGNENASGSGAVSGDIQTKKFKSRSPVDCTPRLNIFSRGDIKIKITDFGTSCTRSDILSSPIPTSPYTSLEMLIAADYGPPVDIWSIACIAYELATGDVLFYPPSFDGVSKHEIHIGLMIQLLGNIPRTIQDAGLLSPKYLSESGDLINVDTSERCSLDQRLALLKKWNIMLAFPFADFLLSMLKYDPTRRPTASECLQDPWLKL
ncbi:unnamed protein product [Nezara viridula]|uniref:non-specific serine/threonine protein kinase n=1 Tax=Nezara viridula TaxID=85310 RepID=A0A9P0H0U5_NEZVI|nr:unnamed protein product [Nezara viridula]